MGFFEGVIATIFMKNNESIFASNFSSELTLRANSWYITQECSERVI